MKRNQSRRLGHLAEKEIGSGLSENGGRKLLGFTVYL
jgi:hypothetical protein